MTLSDELSEHDKGWLLRWTLWPVGLYLLGAFINLYSIFLFPFTLTIVQYVVLDLKVGRRRPALWFYMVFVYALFFWCIAILPGWLKQAIGDSLWLTAYYASQCAGELLLFFMFKNWRWAWYTCFNLLACASWLIVSKMNEDIQYSGSNPLWLYVIIPAIAIITNVLTGYGLIKATETTEE